MMGCDDGGDFKCKNTPLNNTNFRWANMTEGVGYVNEKIKISDTWNERNSFIEFLRYSNQYSFWMLARFTHIVFLASTNISQKCLTWTDSIDDFFPHVFTR